MGEYINYQRWIWFWGAFSVGVHEVFEVNIIRMINRNFEKLLFIWNLHDEEAYNV